MGGRIWSKPVIAAIFEGVCGTAADFGGWTPEAAAVVRRLAQALDIEPNLPGQLDVWHVRAPDLVGDGESDAIA